MAVTIVPHNDFLKEQPESTSFWVQNLIPQGGVVLLWGHTSIGKSPFSWHLALSIADGTPFFFLPAKKGKVLYIELDTPRNLVHERAKTLPFSDNLYWIFLPGLNVDTPDWHSLGAQAASLRPDVVFINTLRKAHTGSDIESHVPSEVYARYQRLFPTATIVFIHHARKIKGEPGLPASEGFSGAQAWQNDAQLACRLYRCKPTEDDDDCLHLALDITKSQVCATGELLRVSLLGDGVVLAPEDYTKTMMQLLEMDPNQTQKDMATKLGINTMAVSRAIKKLQGYGLKTGCYHANSLVSTT